VAGRENEREERQRVEQVQRQRKIDPVKIPGEKRVGSKRERETNEAEQEI